MTDSESMSGTWQFFRKYRPHLFWLILIGLFLYRGLLPEVLFVNGSGVTIDHIKITIPDDDKVWRNIAHGKSKTFRYQPPITSGRYELFITLSDGSLIRGNFKVITPWNFGHKAIFELSPDHKLRAEFNYSLFQ
jgi:hypothetical protein